MESVKVSSKFRVTLPKSVRGSIGIAPGQKLVVFGYADRIVMVPERPIQEARGSLIGKGTSIEREESDSV